MSIYKRIKTLLLEVSARNNPDVISRIATRKAIKNKKSLDAGANHRTSPDHRLAKKYANKHRSMVGELPEPSYKPSRLPNSGKSASFKAKL